MHRSAGSEIDGPRGRIDSRRRDTKACVDPVLPIKTSGPDQCFLEWRFAAQILFGERRTLVRRMGFLADEDQISVEALLSEGGGGGPASQACPDDHERRRHLHLNDEAAVIDAERIRLDRLRRGRREHRTGRDIELSPVAATRHDRPFQCALRRKRALLMCARIVDRKVAPIRIGDSDADSLDVECRKLAGLDSGRGGNGHGSGRYHR